MSCLLSVIILAGESLGKRSETMTLKTTLGSEWRVTCKVELICVGCGREYHSTIHATIAVSYNLATRQIEYDRAALSALEKSVMPRDWTEVSKSKTFSGEIDVTTWSEWYCPNCHLVPSA